MPGFIAASSPDHRMISGYDIVCFSPNRWDSLWRNRHQIMSRLARHNRVLFVEPAGYLRDRSNSVQQETAKAPNLISPLNNLWVYRPPDYAPISGRRPLSEITFAMRRSHLRRTMQRLGMNEPLVWIFQYNLGEMIGRLGERLVIYHAVDEYTAYILGDDQAAAEKRRRAREMEESVIARSDLVFVTSPALFETKRTLHEHVVLVPNGVDYEHFARPSANPLPADIANLPRPLIGYAGVINEKLDYELLLATASARSEWQFVLVGPNVLRTIPPAFIALQALPNVHFVGNKSIAELPAYIQSCDVCLIPYVQNEWTRNISPLKLYEYLAAGTPIVVKGVPAAQEFANLIWITDDAPAFVASIQEALAAPPDLRKRQQAAARQHTWDQRIEALSDAIVRRLADLGRVRP
ncbi:MAG: glycosyltransferase [Caldilineales bacterium]|nr:glycosyltransferase [Caldilineales bacterium]